MSTLKSLIWRLDHEKPAVSEEIEAHVPSSVHPALGEVTVRISRLMMKTYLVSCFALVPGSVVILLISASRDPFFIGLSGATAGLFAVLFAMALRPGSYILELNRQGFVSTRIFRRRVYRWRDVIGFTTVRTDEGADLVGFDLDAERSGHQLRRLLYNVDRTLPPCALPAPELTAAMNLWRHAYAPVLNEQLAQR